MRTPIFLSILVIVASTPGFAQTIPLPNGDFETGTLTSWAPGGVNGGTASIVQEGTCFSHYNTKGITLGGSFAANVRSSPAATTDSVGILTSDPFVVGSSITFNALSEGDDGGYAPFYDNPVTFEARLLDLSGNTLLSQVFKTNFAALNHSTESCGGEPRNAAFSNHSLDTSSFSGQTVQLQFRQHTNVPKLGFFTLVDDVRISPADPVISLTVTSCIACEQGGRLTVVARVVNPRSHQVRVEVKAGGRLPDGTPVNLFGQQHMELTLAPGLDKTVTLVDGPLPPGVLPGTWTVEGTLLEPELGKTFSHDARTIEIER